MHELVRQCHNGLDADGLHRQLLRSLRRLLPVDAAFFATADPETWLFTGAPAEEPLAAVPRGMRRQVCAAVCRQGIEPPTR